MIIQLKPRHGPRHLHSKPLPLTESMKIVENQTIVLNIPNILCSDKICSTNIQVDYNNRVNATVNEVVVNAGNDKLCMYSGLAAVEKLGNDDYKETESFCDNHDSHNSSLLIILYWYSIYNTITVRLSITLPDISLCTLMFAALSMELAECMNSTWIM